MQDLGMKKKLLVIGGKSDIGMAAARCFAANGFDIQLAARQSAQLKNDAADFKIRYQCQVTLHELDVLDIESHESFIAGFESLPDVVLSAAGFSGSQSFAQKGFHHARQVIDTNYTGLVSLMEKLASRYEQRGHGCMIGISSVAGDRGRKSNYIYGSAKAAYAHYLSGLRNRLARFGVSVITVKPGFVHTRMTQGMSLPRLITASPEAVADDIYKAYKNKRNIIYSRWYWRWIMLIIKGIPESIFKKLSL